MNKTIENRIEYLETEIALFQRDITNREIELTNVKNRLWKSTLRLAHRINNTLPLMAQSDKFNASEMADIEEMTYLQEQIEKREDHLNRWLEGVKNIEKFIYIGKLRCPILVYF